jgi:predicted acetyltransferase
LLPTSKREDRCFVSDQSSVEIRVVDPEEFVTFEVGHYAFGKTPSKPDPEQARERLRYMERTTCLAVFVDGKPQATASVLAMRENLRNRILPMAGIGGVASLPSGRRQGLVRQMLTYSFGLMRESGTPVSTLYPFRDSFYERLGYAEFAKNRFTTLKPEHLAPLLRVSLPGTVEQLPIEECFDEWWAFQERLIAERHGFSLFDRSRAVLERDRNAFWVALAREEGVVTGAMTFEITGYTKELRASSFQYMTAGARYQLLAWIARHVDQVSEAVLELGPEEYPELWYRDLVAQSSTVYTDSWPAPMGRVISVAEIEGMTIGSEAEIGVTLVDDLCPWNSGDWTLSGSGGQLAVRPGGNPACHLTIQGLSALVWSGMDPAIFEYRGWGDPDPAAQQTLRGLFPKIFPELNEKF